jgi:aryl-alcohol dehydrogenase-like predicted oxidoreductase
MEQRPFGTTGLDVSALGLGTGHLGDPRLSEEHVGTVLNRALDLGVTLVDTAPSYGLAEERIGRHLAHRRGDFVLSTKCGYGVPGVPDWTGRCVVEGVERALRRLRTDHLDILHLHSCPRETLERPELFAAMEQVVSQGKVRVAAYSGENGALEFALGHPLVRGIQLSVNVCDQRSLDGAVRQAGGRGVGVIAKRPLANAPWRFAEEPVGHYGHTYWRRLRAMELDPGVFDWDEWALRFSAHAEGVCACIAGTSSLEHLERNVRLVERGPLPASMVEWIRARFRQSDQDWVGQI